MIIFQIMKNLLIYVRNFMKKFAQPDSGQKKIEDVSMGEKKKSLTDCGTAVPRTHNDVVMVRVLKRTALALICMQLHDRGTYDQHDQLWH